MTPDFSKHDSIAPAAPLRVRFYTLGCKLNFSETSTMGKLLSERGIVKAGEDDTPDLCVVNTCSVTEMADKKARSLIRKINRSWPEATVVVTGCYAQLKPEEVAALPGVQIVLGSNEKLRIAEFIDEWIRTRSGVVSTTAPLDIKTFRYSCERGDRTRFFLKVQDGCDYFCSYCTIPFARGRSRSGEIARLVEQAREAAAAGGKEIVLTGVNIGEFGRDSGESFFDLLRALNAVEGIERYRISSIEPNLLTDEIIDWIASGEAPKFMPHFHIPLQAGSDNVLRLMRRRYDTELFRSRLEKIRATVPDAFIGVDIIAGARGETPEEWKKGLDFVESLPLTRLHVFPYSERPGTKALALEYVVSQEDKHKRAAMLAEVSDRKITDFMLSMRGQTRPVLWEHAIEHHDDNPTDAPSLMTGLTDNYIRVTAPLRPELINTVTQVRLLDIDPTREESMTAIHV